jgi:uncharacterized membrane protein HdeD (DUF308 family)
MSTTDPSTSSVPRGTPTQATVPSQRSPGGLELQRQHRWWDILLGIVLLVTGVVVLGDVVLASVVSVLFLGWTLLLGGATAVVLSLFRVRRAGAWIGLLGGALSVVAGIVMLRHPGASLLTLSLVVGGLFLVTGIVRLVAAVQTPEQRWLLVISGAASVLLGWMVLERWPASSFWLLGTLLGVYLLVDGLMMILVGRLRVVPVAAQPD